MSALFCLGLGFAGAWSIGAEASMMTESVDASALSPAFLKLPYARIPDFVTLGVPSPPRPADYRQAMAKPYLDAAAGLCAQGSRLKAMEILEQGLELSPDNPDILYALAYQKYLVQGLGQEALELLVRAEASMDWYYSSPEAARELHCRLLFVLGRYVELDSYLTGRNLREQDPSFLYWSIRLRQALPTIKGKDKLIERAFKLYPDQARFMMLKLLESPALEFSDRQWFDSHRKTGQDWLEAQAFRIRRLGPSDEQRKAIVDYLSAGGQDPWVSAWALANLWEGKDFSNLTSASRLPSLDLGEKKLIQNLSTASGDQDLDVVLFLLGRQLALGRPDAGIWKTEKDFILYRDADRDGFPEERISFHHGLPVLWSRDAGQDGVGEFLLQFEDGIPLRLESRREGKLFAYQYSEYPELSTALVLTKSSSNVFFLHERALEIRMIELPAEENPDPLSLLGALVLPPRYHLPETANLRDEAYLDYQGAQKSPGPVRIERCEDGVVFASLVDLEGDGVFESLQVYDKGKLVLSLESVDKNGVWDRFRFVDVQGKEKVLVFSPQASLRYKLDRASGLEVWDVNQDRSLDYQELMRLADETKRFFQEFL